MVTLRTERLVLYALTREQINLALDDIDGLARELKIAAAPDVFSEESRQAMMIKASRMDHIDLALHPWYTYYLLVTREGRQAVGVCGFKGAPTMLGSVELGYAMQEAFRNHGYMTEAVRSLVGWAFQHENCRVVIAETLRDNLASQRVLQKAGLALDHAAENMLYWKIDKDEYLNGGAGK